MSHQDASVKSILFALLANLGIAITKTVAAVMTGSGAMMAESIHRIIELQNDDRWRFLHGLLSFIFDSGIIYTKTKKSQKAVIQRSFG